MTRSSFLASCLREIHYFLANFNIEIRAHYILSKENKLADLCSRAYCTDTHFNNFNKLLLDGLLVLDNLYYDKFNFQYDF